MLAAWDAAPALEDRTRAFEAASALVREDLKAFWDWFLGLSADKRANGSLARAVIASFRGAAPVPRRAYLPMLRGAVEERDPSFNRVFVEPCVRAYGGTGVADVFLELLRTGAASEKAGAASALYWVLNLGGGTSTHFGPKYGASCSTSSCTATTSKSDEVFWASFH